MLFRKGMAAMVCDAQSAMVAKNDDRDVSIRNPTRSPPGLKATALRPRWKCPAMDMSANGVSAATMRATITDQGFAGTHHE